jgi:alpha/beta superfamily hydrolase
MFEIVKDTDHGFHGKEKELATMVSKFLVSAES